MKNSDIFFISAQNIDCGYEYPQSMFLSGNKKNNVYPCIPQFYYIKVGFMGSKLYRHVFVMSILSRVRQYKMQLSEALGKQFRHCEVIHQLLITYRHSLNSRISLLHWQVHDKYMLNNYARYITFNDVILTNLCRVDSSITCLSTGPFPNRRGVWLIFVLLPHLKESLALNVNTASTAKQCRPWSDAIWSWSTLFANVSFMGSQA